jgi:aryl-alcohol dehydrogenase
VNGVAVGDHVVLTYAACGGCRACLGGRLAYCLDFFGRNLSGGRPDGSRTLTRGGVPVGGNLFGQSSFATHALASAASVVVVPRRLPLELLGPLGCAFQTGAGSVLNVLKPAVGSSLVVFGVGAVGLTAVMAACAVGCGTVIAVDRHRHRLSLAAELGAHHTLDAGTADIVEEIVDLTAGGADCSVDATGVADVLGQAVACLSVGGTCALVGAAPVGTSAAVDPNHLLWGRSIRGVIEGGGVPRLR